jgi:ABC-type multidrug transport system fused ATPase/permease subunit
MFRRFSAGQRRSAVGAVALMAVEAATALVVPILIGDLTNFLKDGKPWRPLGLRLSADATIPLLAVSIVVATAVNSLSEALSDVSLAKAGRVLGYNLRTALFSHLQKLSLAFHVRRSTGDVLTRITGDVHRASWLHPAVQSRADFLDACARDPERATAYRRRMDGLWYGLTALYIALPSLALAAIFAR